MVYDDHGQGSQNNKHRTSLTATIQRQQTFLVKCIEQRFAHFQGNIDLHFLEPLQLVKYTNDQQVSSFRSLN